MSQAEMHVMGGSASQGDGPQCIPNLQGSSSVDSCGGMAGQQETCSHDKACFNTNHLLLLYVCAGMNAGSSPILITLWSTGRGSWKIVWTSCALSLMQSG
jgi:hypothetical protein